MVHPQKYSVIFSRMQFVTFVCITCSKIRNRPDSSQCVTILSHDATKTCVWMFFVASCIETRLDISFQFLNKDITLTWISKIPSRSNIDSDYVLKNENRGHVFMFTYQNKLLHFIACCIAVFELLRKLVLCLKRNPTQIWRLYRPGFTICTAVHVVTSKNHLKLFDFNLK